jgi:hypothetical protein
MDLLVERGATRSKRSVVSTFADILIGSDDDWRSPIGALDINQRRIHRSLELTKRALGMEWEQLKSQAGGLQKLGRRLGKDEGDIRRVVMWVESLEWRQSWNHILGDLKQLHT